jgi:hypothetical protein
MAPERSIFLKPPGHYGVCATSSPRSTLGEPGGVFRPTTRTSVSSA